MLEQSERLHILPTHDHMLLSDIGTPSISRCYTTKYKCSNKIRYYFFMFVVFFSTYA